MPFFKLLPAKNSTMLNQTVEYTLSNKASARATISCSGMGAVWIKKIRHCCCRMRKKNASILPALLFLFLSSGLLQAQRVEVTSLTPLENAHTQEWGNVYSLDGTWEIAEGRKNQQPVFFSATTPVPGLVSAAQPSFKDVGLERDAGAVYWLRKKFRIADSIPALARLKIFKAMFGTHVFLNGKAVGENSLNFTPLYFNLRPFLKGNNQENELLISIGAGIASAPDSVVAGGDPERHRYPPGIYDHVQIILSGDPYILRTQVAPDIATKKITVAIQFAAEKAIAMPMRLQASIYEWGSNKVVARASISSGTVRPGKENKTILTIAIPNCKLWSPESPNLYVLKISGKQYRYATRFGMRSFAVDTAFTNRAMLNNKPCFLRGTNLAAHRFFEDTACRQYPWDSAWVRKLFRRFTSMEMNAARASIGPPPELWYEMADEEGMMIMDEYAIWYAYQPAVGSVTEEAADLYKKWGIWPKNLTTAQLINEYTAWMQERWNHACVIVWDAQNETWAPQTGEAINAVRNIDLSRRIWDNGWSPPASPADIREAHPYFERWVAGTEMKTVEALKEKPFTTQALATAGKLPSTFYLPYQSAYSMPHNWYWKQPCVINEYSYLWLHRNGNGTTLTKDYYDAILGANATAAERQNLYARNLAAVTEYWRACRSCFALLYPFGIAGSIEGGATSDNFTDIPSLSFDAAYTKYVPDAFAALGVCAELWQTDFEYNSWSGAQAEFPVAIINDTENLYNSYFTIEVLQADSICSSVSYRYAAAPFAVNRRMVKIDLPKKAGRYSIVTSLHGSKNKVVKSWRDILLKEEK